MKERDIELAFIKWFNTTQYHTVIARQVSLPFGKLDVLAISDSNYGLVPIVIEIKKGVIDEKACTQLLGYKSQVSAILTLSSRVNLANSWEADVECGGILVGSDINSMVERVIKGWGMSFIQYRVNGGKITFHEETEYGFEMTDAKLTGALGKVRTLVDAARMKHRATCASNLTHQDFFGYLDDSIPGDLILNAGSVEYWSRKAKAQPE